MEVFKMTVIGIDKGLRKRKSKTMIEKTITTTFYDGLETTDFEQDGRLEGYGTDVILIANDEDGFDIVETSELGDYIDWLMEEREWSAMDLLKVYGSKALNLYVDYLRYGVLTTELEQGLIDELGEGQTYNTFDDAEELEELTSNIKIDVDYNA